MRRALPLIALLTLGATPDPLAGDRRRLAEAKAAATAASARAADLERAAAAERDAAAKARALEEAVAARVTRAEADLAAARARLAIVDGLLARQRGDLAERQEPAARLLGALETLARRPAIATMAQPGSIDDIVHLRAVLGSILPEIQARTASLRAEVARTRRLRADATLATTALRDSRTALARERQALAALEARHSGQALALRRDALAQSDRAIAMGESARDIVDRMASAGDEDDTRAALARLAGPPAFAPQPRPAPAYRMPVAGRLVTGMGEVSGSGVRARGLTFAVNPGAAVVAPAAGTVIFARPFRGYRHVVILDHGDGWTSVVTGLADATLRRGATVATGQLLGRAPGGDAPQVTVELYRRGRPVDIAALAG